jgi:hypothetical protein
MKVIGARPVLLEAARASEGARGLHDPTGRLRRRQCGFLSCGTGVTLSRRDGLFRRRPRVSLCGEMDPAKTAPSQETSDHSGIGSVHQGSGGADRWNAKSREASGRRWTVRRFAYFLVLVLLSMAALNGCGGTAGITSATRAVAAATPAVTWAQSAAHWQVQSSGQAKNLWSVHFLDATRGWVVGMDGITLNCGK